MTRKRDPIIVSLLTSEELELAQRLTFAIRNGISSVEIGTEEGLLHLDVCCETVNGMVKVTFKGNVEDCPWMMLKVAWYQSCGEGQEPWFLETHCVPFELTNGELCKAVAFHTTADMCSVWVERYDLETQQPQHATSMLTMDGQVM